MTPPRVAITHLAGDPDLPLLVLGPALGTSVVALWETAAQLLEPRCCVIGWDLPGHGVSPAPRTSFSVEDLADAVMKAVRRTTGASTFAYAGVSVGGAVGLQLALGHSDAITAAAVMCTGATIGEPDEWRARARNVRMDGTEAMVEMARRRWFATGFAEREPRRAADLLESLRTADDEGYAATCEALAGFDLRSQLCDISTPILAIAGAKDVATPSLALMEISMRVTSGEFVELPATGHLPPVERPRRIATLLCSLHERVPH